MRLHLTLRTWLLALLLASGVWTARAQYPWSHPPATNLFGTNQVTLYPYGPGVSNSSASNYAATLSNLAQFFLGSNVYAGPGITIAVTNNSTNSSFGIHIYSTNTWATTTNNVALSVVLTNGAQWATWTQLILAAGLTNGAEAWVSNAGAWRRTDMWSNNAAVSTNLSTNYFSLRAIVPPNGHLYFTNRANCTAIQGEQTTHGP